MLSPKPWSFEGMKPRRERMFEDIRREFRRYVNADGVWQSPPGVNANEDPRVFVEVALPYFLGDASDRKLAEKLLRQPSVLKRMNNCAFCNEYHLAMLYCGGDAIPGAVRQGLLDSMRGYLVERYATKDLQHHGYNDNHVTLATSTLVLGGQLLGDKAAVEAGRDNLLNFRDTLLRRGFIHETNDCYLVHTLYTTAIVGQFAEDAQIRQLARDCEARIWFDYAAHWHPNLARKIGPSARDYTGGRLFNLHSAVALWGVLGDEFKTPLMDTDTIFMTEPPAWQFFQWQDKMEDASWKIGFIARMLAHGYEVPQKAYELFCNKRSYPFEIEGTHEVGNGMESYRPLNAENPAWSSPPRPVPGAIPFSGSEIHSCGYYERDWGMGTASHRMIGGCPNNNFEIAYRKKEAMKTTADQGMLFCSFTINDKNVARDREFKMVDFPANPNQERQVAWFDQGFYAGFQHKSSSIMMYRPRIADRMCLEKLSTTLIYPLVFGNSVDRLELGDTEIRDFAGESAEVEDVFIADGPVYIGIRFLMPRPQSCAGPRIRVRKEGYYGLIDCYIYDGKSVSLEETDLARLGGGFFCEVSSRDSFATLAEFKAYFRSIKVLDEQNFMMRQTRVKHPKYLFGMRYDSLADSIIYRMVNNRQFVPPQFRCTGVAEEEVPFLTGDVSGLDGFEWAERVTSRTPAEAWPECGTIIGAGKI